MSGWVIKMVGSGWEGEWMYGWMDGRTMGG